MIDILRYVLSTSAPSDTFLPNIPNLSDVRRLTLKESCRAILLSSFSASSSAPNEREVTEQWIKDVVQKAIVSSPTLSEEERNEAKRKIYHGCWIELFLDNDISAAEAEREGQLVGVNAIEGLAGLKRMLHSILTHSQAVWKLSPSDRRDFVADALFDDPDEGDCDGEGKVLNVYKLSASSGNNEQTVLQRRQLFQNRFVAAMKEIQDDVEFDTERKSRISDDISFMDYVLLLLPDRFDCEEIRECGSSTGVYISSSGLSAVSSARRRMSSFSMNSYYKSIRFEESDRPPCRGGLKRDSSDISFQESLELDEDLQPNGNFSRYHRDSVSAELAEFANVTIRTARTALDKTDGNKEEAALVLLNLVKSVNRNEASRHLSVSSEKSSTSLDNGSKFFTKGSRTDSMKLAGLAGTSRARARLAIDDAHGDLDEAADLLLTIMCDEHDSPASSLRMVNEERASEPSSIPTTAAPEREVEVCDPLGSDSFHILARHKRGEDEKKAEDEEECLMCPICFTTLDASIEDDDAKGKEKGSIDVSPRKLKCGHCFCRSCLKNWVGKKGIPFPCPVCRTKIGYMSYHLKPWLEKKTTGKGKKKRFSAPVFAASAR